MTCPANPSTDQQSVKEEFIATFETLARDRGHRGRLRLGEADIFIAGAIEEFVALRSVAEAERLSADGQEMLDRVARFPKPVVAAIHGACLGGGLEFALACSYRVATDHPKTQLGLPEVQLGILPAAGGCQRLPRLIGARAALDIILAGKVERALKAFRLGIVDELVPHPILREVSLAAARRLAGGWQPVRKRPGGVVGWLLDGNPLGRRIVFRQARRQVLAATRGNYPAPLAALDAVEYGFRHGMAEACKGRRSCLASLRRPTSRASSCDLFATTQLKKDLGGRTRRSPLDFGDSRLWERGSWARGSPAPRWCRLAWTSA